ncbi:MAG TPA: restriction endonuclease subunit S [Prolixibacteraceae bacterium]|nr:restriction endonuclease subunit S [Prolixibacteraceae bacterium]
MSINKNHSSDNIPQLRFPEFEGEWEKKRLNEISKINPSNQNLPEWFIYIDLESVKQGLLIKEELILKKEAPSRAQRLLKKGDILFQMVRPYQKNNYFFNENKVAVASTGYAQIRTEQNNEFLYQFLHTDEFVKKALLRCTGTSYPAINSNDLSNISIKYPTLPEQQKIASFLTAVDEKLTALKKKKELLEQYKKGVMQGIFSQNQQSLNHDLPDSHDEHDLKSGKSSQSQKSRFRQLRFKDENGKEFPNWQKIKLGELTIKVGKKNKENIPYPVYSINNKEGFLPQSDQFEGMDSNNRGYDISMYKIIGKNTFAYNPARINVGSIGFSGELHDIIISSLYVCFKTRTELEDGYLMHYLNTFDFNKSVLRNVEGGVRDYLFYENFSNIKIPLPSNKEQTKIANFLTAIDNKINQCQQQIEATSQWKKGLLQKMFV